MAQSIVAGFDHENHGVAQSEKRLRLMSDTARAKPVLIEEHGRGVVVVVSVQACERLSVQSGGAARGKRGQKGAL